MPGDLKWTERLYRAVQQSLKAKSESGPTDPSGQKIVNVMKKVRNPRHTTSPFNSPGRRKPSFLRETTVSSMKRQPNCMKSRCSVGGSKSIGDSKTVALSVGGLIFFDFFRRFYGPIFFVTDCLFPKIRETICDFFTSGQQPVIGPDTSSGPEDFVSKPMSQQSKKCLGMSTDVAFGSSATRLSPKYLILKVHPVMGFFLNPHEGTRFKKREKNGKSGTRKRR